MLEQYRFHVLPTGEYLHSDEELYGLRLQVSHQPSFLTIHQQNSGSVRMWSSLKPNWPFTTFSSRDTSFHGLYPPDLQ